MTCNPDWPEIQSELCPGQHWSDIPLVIIRVFRRRLTLLENCLQNMFPNAGKLLYCIHSVEFQKRGLPHAHILLKFESNCVSPEDIDAIVSAEIPEDLPESDANLVHQFMLHKHPRANNPPSKYCQRENEFGHRTCHFHYPHPLQDTKTLHENGRIHYHHRNLGDEIVVPHCLPLLHPFHCHINFEVANTSHIFQYLFKYLLKGKSSLRI
jgi:hypothetical protein